MMRSTSLQRAASLTMIAVALLIAGCEPPEDPFAYTETREVCTDFRPERRALFGDFHVHTGFSFDARVYDNQMAPLDAHRFAQGEPITLTGGRVVQLDTPLDFVGVTDHSEFLGEVARCTTPGLPGYDSTICENYRNPLQNGALSFGTLMASTDPQRWEEVCGTDDCAPEAEDRWGAMQDAAETAYDRTASCTFSAFPSYEYTNTRGVSNRHRNVFFRNGDVPNRPVTTFEAPDQTDLWEQLDDLCIDADDECDVIVIPHNSNLSNGWEFSLFEQTAEDLELRARMEPLVEIFQHKGDSECRAGLLNGDPDPLCDFEKLRPADDEICGGALGSGGMRLWGCVDKLDFVRNVLIEGLVERQAGRVNPYQLGIIGSTDTHNATPGYTDSIDFQGHVGTVDDTIEDRLGDGNITHDTIITNPGGLTAVWAEENSRDAIFRGLRRKEVFATSGPRMTVRFFGGWDLPTNACSGGDLTLYDDGVPMGSELEDKGGEAPMFAVMAQQDKLPLQRVQIIKGWVSGDGTRHEQVYDVAGDANNGADVDTGTCDPSGAGEATLCAVWTDPDFNDTQHAVYYARVLQNPTCRWTTRQCNTFAEADRPPRCEEVPKTVQQRAWSSPIWYVPE